MPVLFTSLRDERYTLPHLFERNALLKPDAPFLRYLDGDDENGPITDISARQILQMASATAGHLGQLGCAPRQAGEPLKVVAFYGTSGISYYTYLVACLLMNWTVLLVSTRNSDAAVEHLLRISEATHILSDGIWFEKAQKLQNVTAIKIEDVPPSDNVWSSAQLSPEQFSKALTEPALYLHTSGTTGHPKLIPFTHEFVVSGIQRVHNGNYTAFKGASMLTLVPLFHAIGFWNFTMIPFATGVVPVIVHSKRPMDGARLLSILKRINSPSTIVFSSPATLEEVAGIPDGPKTLATMSGHAFWGGGSVKQELGDRLARAGVILTSVYGATEFGPVTPFRLSSDNPVEDWNYLSFLPEINVLLKPVDDGSGLRELLILPSETATTAIQQYNHENPKAWATMDLWSPHPTREGLWKHHGRMDSITVLSNGEKTNNRQIETLLLQDPLIARVVVFGSGRFLNGVLLSSSPNLGYDSSSDPERYLDQIWNTIVNANEVLPQHSALVRQLVLVEKTEKPFIMSDKGTVRAVETLSQYEEDINAAYGRLEEGEGALEVELPDEGTPDTFKAYIKKLLVAISISVPSEDADFFDYGVDSLIAIKIRSHVVSFLKHKTDFGDTEIIGNLIYTYSSIDALTRFVFNTSNGVQSTEHIIQELIQKHTEGLPQTTVITNGVGQITDSKANVLLTGCTGSLGSHILLQLLSLKNVERVYCLVRNTDTENSIRERLMVQFGVYGLPKELLAEKASSIVILPADLSDPNLGLSASTKQELESKVTHIIHGAWRLDFNLPVERFSKTEIAGVRHLIDLSLAQPLLHTRFIFISSIGSVQNHSSISAVPEQSFSVPSIAGFDGYSQSKYTAERIIDVAVSRAGLDAIIIRGGQLSGSSQNGYWNPKEYIPSLFKTSAAIRAFPDHFMEIRWLPVDIAGKIVVKLSLNATSRGYYHLENPVSTSWSYLVNLLSSHAQKTAKPTPVEPVSMSEWLRLIVQASQVKSVDEIPAIKLMDFFRGIGENTNGEGANAVVLDVQRTREVAPEIDVGVLSDVVLLSYWDTAST
ncbi:acetyl- synthetase-like protein [Lentinula edodes]|uniref:Acetyl-synthetase-like protein n=1 Tax=Lentinula edodes TaxID=5353 RepID=A0A1Q3DYS5_LENED|nr:acetyl- synthetase-like protein [Lentinula edodes]